MTSAPQDESSRHDPSGDRSRGFNHGTMAEEAAKLVDVAQLWLAGRRGFGATGYGSATGDAEDVWSAATMPADGTGEDSAVPPECHGCPYCRVRRVVSGMSPDVYAHLADAVSSVSAALQAMEAGRSRGTTK